MSERGEPRGDRLPAHSCLGPGPCPHEGCRGNREEEEMDEADRNEIKRLIRVEKKQAARIQTLEKERVQVEDLRWAIRRLLLEFDTTDKPIIRQRARVWAEAILAGCTNDEADARCAALAGKGDSDADARKG